MKFNNILENEVFEIPKNYNKNISFRDLLKKNYEEYINILKKIEPKLIQVKNFKTKTNIDKIIEKQQEFINGLLETIDLYYEGKPASAYFKFEEIIEKRKKGFRTMLSIDEFDINQNFYRIRTSQENFPFNNYQMFHISFESRGKVSTQRYSIPGFPSLYISKTLYVAWEELKRPNVNDFQAIRLTNKSKIKFLDLTSQKINISIDEITSSNYKYVMTFPLILACSIRVKNYNDIFKPEYIIPQILLQWIRENDEIDAIKYSSTHIKNNEKKLEGDLYNLVLPVRENKDKGLCTSLTNKFEITETISKQLIDFTFGGTESFCQSETEKLRITKKIPRLEIINGTKTSYNTSILGKMEYLLDIMKTKKII